MIEELIEQGQYDEALSMLEDRNDENVRYLRLVCLVGLGEYQNAKTEGMIAKAMAVLDPASLPKNTSSFSIG